MLTTSHDAGSSSKTATAHDIRIREPSFLAKFANIGVQVAYVEVMFSLAAVVAVLTPDLHVPAGHSITYIKDENVRIFTKILVALGFFPCSLIISAFEPLDELKHDYFLLRSIAFNLELNI